MKIACVQLNSGDELQENLRRAQAWVEEAANAGACIVILPENFAWCARDEAARKALAVSLQDSPIVAWMRALSSRLGIVLVGAGLPLAGSRKGKARNAAVVVECGEVLAAYAKMHLFDVEIPGESWHESAHTEAGERPVIVETMGLRIGLAICYDLRFPELFRAYAGCDLMALGAAFTVPTGKAHWEALLRARAIENQCYVAAAAQWGRHPGGRETFGHSMIIGPWGEVCAVLEEGEGVIAAELDRSRIADVRRRLPALAHRRAVAAPLVVQGRSKGA